MKGLSPRLQDRPPRPPRCGELPNLLYSAQAVPRTLMDANPIARTGRTRSHSLSLRRPYLLDAIYEPTEPVQSSGTTSQLSSQ